MGFLYVQGAEQKPLVYKSHKHHIDWSEGILLQVKQGMLQEGMAKTLLDRS